MSTANGLYDSITALLPTGYAWPRDPDSVLMRVMHGIAQSHADLVEFTQATVRQWQPHTSTLRLGEWEKACGLPDLCFGAVQEESLRRAMLLRKLRGPVLHFDNSSPGSPDALERVCEELGYDVTVRYNLPARVGRDRVGRRLGALDGQLYFTATVGVLPARVGVSRVGDRLASFTQDPAPLACYLRHVVPARFVINLVLV